VTGRLSHLFVHVRDLDETVSFWTELVGLRLLVREPGYARVGTDDGFTLGLEERDQHLVGAVGITIAIEVPDVHVTYERMLAAGVAVAGPPAAQPWGAVHAFLEDPNGYRCSIFST
jgi:catechol 2,3-dioxygenase-like lactoylglutathione lyase family enzyme